MLLYQVEISNHGPVSIQIFIAGGGTKYKAGNCVQGLQVLSMTILDDGVIITNELSIWLGCGKNAPEF